MTHQLKAFKISLNVQNRINEVQVLSHSYKRKTKYDVAFNAKRASNPPPGGYATGLTKNMQREKTAKTNFGFN